MARAPAAAVFVAGATVMPVVVVYVTGTTVMPAAAAAVYVAGSTAMPAAAVFVTGVTVMPVVVLYVAGAAENRSQLSISLARRHCWRSCKRQRGPLGIGLTKMAEMVATAEIKSALIGHRRTPSKFTR